MSTSTKHHRISSDGPTIFEQRSAVADVTAKIRELAIASIAREEEVSLEEAAKILDTTPPVVAAETPEAIAERRREHERRRISQAVIELGMPVRPELVPQLVRGECLRTRATSEAAAWMKSDRRVLALIGDPGVGKTVASCLTACAFVRRRKVVMYVREPTLVRWWHSSTLSHEARVERLRTADLLIIDELGMTLSRDGEKARDALFGMIDDRIGIRDARTVVLGNLTETELVKAYGARLLDRFREIGVVVHLTGESLRGRGGA